MEDRPGASNKKPPQEPSNVVTRSKAKLHPHSVYNLFSIEQSSSSVHPINSKYARSHHRNPELKGKSDNFKEWWNMSLFRPDLIYVNIISQHLNPCI